MALKQSGHGNGATVEAPNKSPVIIWSADIKHLYDTGGEEGLISIIEREKLQDAGIAIKLDQAFLWRNGLNAISVISEGYGIPVFADLKISEVPVKVMEVTKVILEYHPWMLNVMAGICSTGLSKSQAVTDKDVDALYKFANLCRDADTIACAVTVLTSKTEELIEAEFLREHEEQVLVYASWAAKFGITDIVCSPKEVEILREDTMTRGLCLNTPGIRLRGSDTRDQKRVTTPGEAIQLGANRLVIGQNLTEGEGTFMERLQRIKDDIRETAGVEI